MVPGRRPGTLSLAASTLAGAVLSSALAGCPGLHPSTKSGHPGIQDQNPHAVIRTYPASATRTAWALTAVMSGDSILEDVKLMIDPQSNESRPLPKAEREALGLPSMSISARDVNYNIMAKSKDGKRVGVVIAMKGEAESEVSILYGSMGEPDLCKVLLDEVETAIKGPVKNPGLWKASAAAKDEAKKEGAR